MPQKANSARVKKYKQRIFEMQMYRCAYCHRRKEELTLDHVIPLSKGGGNTYYNLVGCCEKCNSRKSSHDAFMFYQLLHGDLTFQEAKKLDPTIPPAFGMLPIKGKHLKLY